MAIKKKGKKASKSKRAAKKVTAGKRAPKKQAAKKLAAKKRGGTSSRKTVGNKGHVRRKPARMNRPQQTGTFGDEHLASRSSVQSGDLQGLRDSESADSESVGELLEEGNAFEAGIVTGVEAAEDDQEKEVHTHEVPEDDVPEEYLDKN
jgi:hypothetical protein